MTNQPITIEYETTGGGHARKFKAFRAGRSDNGRYTVFYASNGARYEWHDAGVISGRIVDDVVYITSPNKNQRLLGKSAKYA